MFRQVRLPHYPPLTAVLLPAPPRPAPLRAASAARAFSLPASRCGRSARSSRRLLPRWACWRCVPPACLLAWERAWLPALQPTSWHASSQSEWRLRVQQLLPCLSAGCCHARLLVACIPRTCIGCCHCGPDSQAAPNTSRVSTTKKQPRSMLCPPCLASARWQERARTGGDHCVWRPRRRLSRRPAAVWTPHPLVRSACSAVMSSQAIGRAAFEGLPTWQHTAGWGQM